jgi:putative tryptophan/tyrosine transport system substrate-binding protein
MIRRREFITLFGGAAAAWPLAARAQQPTMPVIGFLSSRSPGESASVVAAFRQGLRDTGFIEGQNVSIAFRWAEGRYDRLPTLAAELVDLRVTLMFSAGGAPPALAAKTATSTIPVVFSAVSEPVGVGLVPSLNRPGGNVTGMGIFNAALGPKRMELLKELIPSASVLAYLLNPSNPSQEIETNAVMAVARALGVDLHIFRANSEREIEAAYDEISKLRAAALVVAGEPFFDSQRDRLVALSARHTIAAVYAWREYVLAGGLISYGTDLPDAYRRGGVYAGRILKGEKPADLPVTQPTKFHMAINLKAAKALGLTVPPTLLARADEVIE